MAQEIKQHLQHINTKKRKSTNSWRTTKLLLHNNPITSSLKLALLATTLTLVCLSSFPAGVRAQTVNCRPSDYRSVFGDASSPALVSDATIAVNSQTGDFVVAGSLASNSGSFAYYHDASSNCAVTWKRQFSGVDLIRAVTFADNGTKVLLSATETSSGSTADIFIALDVATSTTDPFTNTSTPPLIIKQTTSGSANAAIFDGGPFMIATDKYLVVGGQEMRLLDHATTTYSSLPTDTNFVNVAAAHHSTTSSIVLGQIPSATATGRIQIQAYATDFTSAKFSSQIDHSFANLALGLKIGVTGSTMGTSASSTLVVFTCSHETSSSSSLKTFYDRVLEGNSQVVSYADYMWSTCLSVTPLSPSEATFAIQDNLNNISVQKINFETGSALKYTPKAPSDSILSTLIPKQARPGLDTTTDGSDFYFVAQSATIAGTSVGFSATYITSTGTKWRQNSLFQDYLVGSGSTKSYLIASPGSNQLNSVGSVTVTTSYALTNAAGLQFTKNNWMTNVCSAVPTTTLATSTTSASCAIGYNCALTYTNGLSLIAILQNTVATVNTCYPAIQRSGPIVPLVTFDSYGLIEKVGTYTNSNAGTNQILYRQLTDEGADSLSLSALTILVGYSATSFFNTLPTAVNAFEVRQNWSLSLDLVKLNPPLTVTVDLSQKPHWIEYNSSTLTFRVDGSRTGSNKGNSGMHTFAVKVADVQGNVETQTVTVNVYMTKEYYVPPSDYIIFLPWETFKLVKKYGLTGLKKAGQQSNKNSSGKAEGFKPPQFVSQYGQEMLDWELEEKIRWSEKISEALNNPKPITPRLKSFTNTGEVTIEFSSPVNWPFDILKAYNYEAQRQAVAENRPGILFSNGVFVQPDIPSLITIYMAYSVVYADNSDMPKGVDPDKYPSLTLFKGQPEENWNFMIHQIRDFMGYIIEDKGNGVLQAHEYFAALEDEFKKFLSSDEGELPPDFEENQSRRLQSSSKDQYEKDVALLEDEGIETQEQFEDFVDKLVEDLEQDSEEIIEEVKKVKLHYGGIIPRVIVEILPRDEEIGIKPLESGEFIYPFKANDKILQNIKLEDKQYDESLFVMQENNGYFNRLYVNAEYDIYNREKSQFFKSLREDQGERPSDNSAQNQEQDLKLQKKQTSQEQNTTSSDIQQSNVDSQKDDTSEKLEEAKKVYEHSWKITQISPDELKLKINFKNPYDLTQTDQLRVTFMIDDFEGGIKNETQILVKIPSQINNKEIYDFYKQVSKLVSQSITGILLFSFSINVLFRGSKVFIYSLLGLIQLIVHISLSLQFWPPLIIDFTIRLSYLANFQILGLTFDSLIKQFNNIIDVPAETNDTLFVDGQSDMLDKHPLAVQAMQGFGYDSHFILRSMQTSIVGLLALILLSILAKVLKPCFEGPNLHNRWVQRVFKAFYDVIFWNLPIFYLLRIYLNASICLCQTLLAPSIPSEMTDDFQTYQMINIGALLVVCGVVFGFPILLTITFFSNKHMLQSSLFLDKFGGALAGLKKESTAAIFYPLMFCLRRLILAFILVSTESLKETEYIQLVMQIGLSLTYSIYLCHCKPIDSVLIHRLEVLNEMVILLILNLSVCYSDLILQGSKRTPVYSLFIYTIYAVILIHLFFILRDIEHRIKFVMLTFCGKKPSMKFGKKGSDLTNLSPQQRVKKGPINLNKNDSEINGIYSPSFQIPLDSQKKFRISQNTQDETIKTGLSNKTTGQLNLAKMTQKLNSKQLFNLDLDNSQIFMVDQQSLQENEIGKSIQSDPNSERKDSLHSYQLDDVDQQSQDLYNNHHKTWKVLQNQKLIKTIKQDRDDRSNSKANQSMNIQDIKPFSKMKSMQVNLSQSRQQQLANFDPKMSQNSPKPIKQTGYLFDPYQDISISKTIGQNKLKIGQNNSYTQEMQKRDSQKVSSFNINLPDSQEYNKAQTHRLLEQSKPLNSITQNVPAQNKQFQLDKKRFSVVQEDYKDVNRLSIFEEDNRLMKKSRYSLKNDYEQRQISQRSKSTSRFTNVGATILQNNSARRETGVVGVELGSSTSQEILGTVELATAAHRRQPSQIEEYVRPPQIPIEPHLDTQNQNYLLDEQKKDKVTLAKNNKNDDQTAREKRLQRKRKSIK